MVHASDEDILAMIKTPASLEQGFRILMKKYQEKLYYVVRRIVESHDDTDDVLQNTFIKVFRAIGNFEERSSLYTWLYRIATNEAITYLKSRKNKQTDALELHSYKLEERSGDDFDAGMAIKKLEVALSGLPERQREVFNMRYYDELSYDQISELLQTSVGALKASYHHAVKKIEAHLLA